jgi:group I intron endonuclease
VSDKLYKIYVITNNVNGRQYIGCTCQTLQARFKQHICDSKRDAKNRNLLYQDFCKYGVDCFDISLIDDNIPEELAGDAERYYIKLYHTYYLDGSGYNMTIGGRGTIGYMFTEADRAKMSLSNSGRKFSDERNEHLREVMTGRYYKPEWKAALSAARMGRFTKEDNSFYGKHHSDETKRKIRESNSGSHVLQIDDNHNVVNEFYNLHDAGQWVSDNGLTKAKGTTCAGRIRVVCCSEFGKCRAYGYFWKFKERSID